MSPRRDGGLPQLLVIEALDVEDREVLANTQIQLLVEIAIEQLSIILDVHSIPTHEVRNGLRIEISHQKIHIPLEHFRLTEMVEESLHRHVGDSEEVVECDTMFTIQFVLVLRLQRFLLGGRNGPGGLKTRSNRSPFPLSEP